MNELLAKLMGVYPSPLVEVANSTESILRDHIAEMGAALEESEDAIEELRNDYRSARFIISIQDAVIDELVEREEELEDERDELADRLIEIAAAAAEVLYDVKDIKLEFEYEDEA